ncbi:MAG: carbon-nitrogen family hydrolase [Candidatus Sumerlaeia bacterium]
MTLTIALCQIPVEDGAWERNTERGLAALERAAALGARIAVLPELWSSGYDLPQAEQYAARNAPLVEQVRALCRRHGLFAVAGSFILSAGGGRLCNTLVAFDPEADRITQYSKMHLFPALGETEVFSPGDEPVLWATAFGRFGLALCFDVRFPEVFRSYFHAGAPLMFVPAQFPYPRIAHWRALLRARAIENACFMVAVNAASRPADNRLFGFSAIVDPWGEPVMELGHDQQIAVATVDPARAVEVDERLGLRRCLHPRFRKG